MVVSVDRHLYFCLDLLKGFISSLQFVIVEAEGIHKDIIIRKVMYV